MNKLKIIFMGTPEYSLPSLELLSANFDVVAVYTQPPSKSGRGNKLIKSSVHTFAEDTGIPVYTPKSLKDSIAQQEFVELNANLAVVVAYGLILPKVILEAPTYGCINAHASLLPQWRGAAPIQRAIMAGDKETGITIMKMDEGLDTGPMLDQQTIKIGNMDAVELSEKLSIMSADMLLETISNLTVTDEITQPNLATYADKIDKKEAAIEWNKSAIEIDRLIRAFAPKGAWFETNSFERIKIIKASVGQEMEFNAVPGEFLQDGDDYFIACGEGTLKLEILQRSGKKAISAQDFFRGFTL